MSLPLITVWSAADSPRLRYVLDWVLTERLGFSYRLVHKVAEARTSRYCIAYGHLPDAFSIPASGLLFESGILPQEVVQGLWHSRPTLFHVLGQATDLPFDLFAAVFYLLSRYEEYGAYTPDRHGRYPYTESILHRAGILENPLVDEWICLLRTQLMKAWQVDLPQKPFRFHPTYDIDIAWSYRHKGFKRSAGAYFRDIVNGHFPSLLERTRVLTCTSPDPYDAFEWMKKLHAKYALVPHYFVLAAEKASAFDKNIPPRHPAMRQLIQSLAMEAPLGLHPSYQTNTQNDLLHAEKNILEGITGAEIISSRQHYIRLFLPATYRALLAAGITADYSMGYSTTLGFRAGTGESFLWYDLLLEETTAFRVHPFCFMDTTARYDLGLDVEASFLRLRQMTGALRHCGGMLTTIFHNFSLGSDAAWPHWRDAYQTFVSEVNV